MRRNPAIIIALGIIAATATSAGAWEHSAAIYGWFCGLEGTIGVADVAEQPVDVAFDDLASHIDFAMAGHYEARGETAVWLVDIAYNGLGSTREGQVGQQTADVKLDLDQWIFELGGGYRVLPELDVILAGRYYTINTGATFTELGQEGSVSEGWFDVFIGARYHTTFGEKWFASVRGDIGAGGSDFAWFGQLALGYNISERVGATAAWRILSIDYSGDEGASYFRYDMVQSGLGVGIGYRF